MASAEEKIIEGLEEFAGKLELMVEVERLRGLLYECWPCVWDSVYGRYPNRRPLLEKMDEFMRPSEAATTVVP